MPTLNYMQLEDVNIDTIVQNYCKCFFNKVISQVDQFIHIHVGYKIPYFLFN